MTTFFHEELKDQMDKFVHLVYSFFATIAVIVLLVFVLGFIYLPKDMGKTEAIIESGQGLNDIANLLKKSGIIRSKTFFVFYVNALGESGNLKAGRYVFEGRLNMRQVAFQLINGLSELDDVQVTVPEGSNIWEIDEILANSLLIKEGDFMAATLDYEGKLFPDTYRFKNPKSEILNPKQIEDKMLENFELKTRELFKNLSSEKQKEIVVVASMLEKEAKTEEDMYLVAGVIKNRLERGILLQVDATVAYGACLKNLQFATYNLQTLKYCDVSQIGIADEIKIDGPYNTYVRAGLPPGPISNPGLKAIGAALNPADTDYLYYLSTRDGGQIIFSKTSTEHAQNRRKHLGL